MASSYPNPSFFQNLSFVEEMHRKFLEDPDSLDPSWKSFFLGFSLGEGLSIPSTGGEGGDLYRSMQLVHAYRVHGHKKAKTNPLEDAAECPDLSLEALGFSAQDLDRVFPSLGFCDKSSVPLRELIGALERIYCSSVGWEYMGGEDREVDRWLQEKIEKGSRGFSREERESFFEILERAELFEVFLHTKYQGQTRFSLEGHETLIPLLQYMVQEGAELGVETWVMGMAHRGRLNVLVHVLQKTQAVVFKEFEDTIPHFSGESGDVKYHQGFSSSMTTKKGKKVHVHLAPNSSCLESIDGVVLGEAKAKIDLRKSAKKVGAILLHGDAALAGQGVVYETLQMAKVEGFCIGGAIHIAINNQIGYTTSPKSGRSTRYCTDIAKAFSAPIFHVNVEDVEGCLFAGKLAVEFRQTFGRDIFLDLQGYRKYGHNEGDEPSYTQPKHYAQIREKKSIRTLYQERLRQEGIEVSSQEEAQKQQLQEGFLQGKVAEEVAPTLRLGESWAHFQQPPKEGVYREVATGVDAPLLERVLQRYTTVPEGFEIHPKLAKWLEEKKGQKEKGIDWGTAEMLAFGSLLLEKIPIRLAGEDSIRGTFSQRHAGWIDQKTEELYIPLAHLEESQAPFSVHNTILSEYGSLAYEFGYSWAHPEALVLWEAQYGDFVIGGQIPIDHYIVPGEQRWNRYSSLVLLLPHDFVGGGPEHSSGRMERFLQLCAQENIQVAYPSTPASYFHLLRRQGKRKLKKPLVVFSPKSLLRASVSFSPFIECTKGAFQEILWKEQANATHLVFCTGKIYYELVQTCQKFPHVAILRLEQIYPVHREKLLKALASYPKKQKAFWVQEEPQNMGAWEFLRPHLEELLGKNCPLLYVGRERSPSPATGSKKKHTEEQQAIHTTLQEHL